MKYEFPIIQNISEVLAAIEGHDEITVAKRDGYTIINYAVVMEDTFPPVNVAGGSAKMRAERSRHDALRRECRGLVFDNETGAILRRPYHKFFNVNEREETLASHVDLSVGHAILEKLDGSMIAPFIFNGELIWGTRLCSQDFHDDVAAFVKNNWVYAAFAENIIQNGFTPIFEWHSQKNRIVLDYGSDEQLILTAVRNMSNGAYVNYNVLRDWALTNGIPYVRAYDPQTDMKEFLDYVRDLKDVEGFVVRFDDGHMLKLKCDWYVQIHKAKEAILQDRNIVELILDGKLDDIKAHLLDDDRDRLTKFENDFNKIIRPLALSIVVQVSNCQRIGNMDRKTFALDYAPKMDAFSRPIAFSMWDDVQYTDAVDLCEVKVRASIRNSLGRTVKYEAIRDVWFPGLSYNA